MGEKREALIVAVCDWRDAVNAGTGVAQAVVTLDAALDDLVADERRQAVAELPCYRPRTVSMTCSEWNQRSAEQIGLCPTCKARQEARQEVG